jgi:hypothetical protein
VQGAHIRAGVMSCSFLCHAKPERVKERSNVTNGSAGY